MSLIKQSGIKEFYLSRFRLNLSPRETIRLPRMNKGITLRGAFGTAFRGLVCVDRNAACDSCAMRPSCPYGFIFTPHVPEDAERLRLNEDIPRPFVIKPPLDGKDAYGPGETLSFDLVLVGKAADMLPYFLVTFRELGERGIGAGRGRFHLARVEAATPEGGWEEIYSHPDQLVKTPSGPLCFRFSENSAETVPQRIRLRFLTPVLLKEKGNWAEPRFGPLMKRLRDRVSALSYFYCGQALEMDFRRFGEMAEEVSTVKSDVRWVEESRFSKHRNLEHLLKGYVGEMELEGDFKPFMPFLGLGELLHVGKATASGRGGSRPGGGEASPLIAVEWIYGNSSATKTRRHQEGM